MNHPPATNKGFCAIRAEVQNQANKEPGNSADNTRTAQSPGNVMGKHQRHYINEIATAAEALNPAANAENIALL